MSTIRRPPAPKSGNAWDILAHHADACYQHALASCTGNFPFSFANRTTRTVKMHLVEDKASGSNDDEQCFAYFLTVPAGSTNVEVPMTTSRIRVTAGFFKADIGHYEVFWENRPFAWGKGHLITVEKRHSCDLNNTRVDVWPGAPVAPAAPAAAAAASATSVARPPLAPPCLQGALKDAEPQVRTQHFDNSTPAGSTVSQASAQPPLAPPRLQGALKDAVEPQVRTQHFDISTPAGRMVSQASAQQPSLGRRAADADLREVGQASLRLFMLPEPPDRQESQSIPGLQFFSLSGDGACRQWVAASLSLELADGSLELRGGLGDAAGL